jgi:biotin transport system substrate-specific component
MTTRAFPLSQGRPLAVTLAGIAGFAIALAAAAQVAIPVPGTAVPITLQPLIVVLAGLWLGPSAGAASMVLYLVAGAAGLPVFAPVGAPGALRLVGPTGGYLLAYPVAAFVTGWLGTRGRSYVARAVAAGAGIAVMYAGGLAQLAIITGSLTAAVLQGVLPFVALDAVKAFAAAALAPRRPSPTV